MGANFLTNLGDLIVPIAICVILAVVLLTIFFGFFRHSNDTIALVILIIGYICAGVVIYLVGSYMFHRPTPPTDSAMISPLSIEQAHVAIEEAPAHPWKI